MTDQTPSPDPELVRSLGLHPGRPSFWTRGRIAGAVAGVLAVLVLGGIMFFRGGDDSRFVTAVVQRGDLTVTVSATGTLAPQNQVDVGAEISGRVDAVLVDYNDPVTVGQELAVINTDQIRAQLAQARAALGAARATVTNNQATQRETELRRDRAQQLFTRGGVSAQDLQAAEADADRAAAAVAKARADVQNAIAQVAVHETALSKTSIRSPIDGVVLDRKVSTGQTVAAQFQTPVLFTLASDLTLLQLQVDIDEADIGVVREGQTASFTVDAFPQRRFGAKLVSLRNAPRTENGVVTYQGVLLVDNSARLLRPGLTATVDILVAEVKDALLVPNGALRFTPPSEIASVPPLPQGEDGEWTGRVWVLEGNRPVPRDLTLGQTNGVSTEVLSGSLTQDELVITDMGARAAGA